MNIKANGDAKSRMTLVEKARIQWRTLFQWNWLGFLARQLSAELLKTLLFHFIQTI